MSLATVVVSVATLWSPAAHAIDSLDDAAPPRELTTPGDAAALQALLAFYDMDAASPKVREWMPFLTALSRNALMRRIVGDGANGSSTADPSLRTTVSEANGAAIEIVAEGLRRVDDADLLAARPLIAKMFSGLLSRCRAVGPDGGARQRRIQVEDEIAGLEPVLTRAVLAIDGGVPPDAIDEARLAADNERATALLLAESGDAVPECDRAANAIRLRLQGPVAGAPLVTRALLRAYVDSPRRPHAYADGGPPVYPPEALRASIVGSQVVRFTIDATGHLESTLFVTSRFAPSTVTRPDGTLVPASELFDAEIRAWLAATIEANPSRYPANVRDGALAATTYEIPFEWQVDAALKKER